MAIIVTGDLKSSLKRKLKEIDRQLFHQKDGYPFNPKELDDYLQRATTGEFNGESSSNTTREAKVSVGEVLTPFSLLTTGFILMEDDNDVLETIPASESFEGKITFFKPNRHLKDNEDLDREYKSRHLKSANPHWVVAVNREDRSFVDDYSQVIQWRDSMGRWCSMHFEHVAGGREIRIYRGTKGFSDFWWFAGVPE